jgi:hypothetical protein
VSQPSPNSQITKTSINRVKNECSSSKLWHGQPTGQRESKSICIKEPYPLCNPCWGFGGARALCSLSSSCASTARTQTRSCGIDNPPLWNRLSPLWNRLSPTTAAGLHQEQTTSTTIERSESKATPTSDTARVTLRASGTWTTNNEASNTGCCCCYCCCGCYWTVRVPRNGLPERIVPERLDQCGRHHLPVYVSRVLSAVVLWLLLVLLKLLKNNRMKVPDKNDENNIGI